MNYDSLLKNIYVSTREKCYIQYENGIYRTYIKDSIQAIIDRLIDARDSRDVRDAMKWLHDPINGHVVDKMVSFPYYNNGLMKIDNSIALNIYSRYLIEPKEGNPENILKLLREQNEDDQYEYILSWLAYLTDNCVKREPKAGNALVLVGDAGSGKTFLVDKILAKIFGEPSNGKDIVTGDNFNADVYRSHIIAIHDLDPNTKDCHALTERLKEVIASEKHTSNAKYGQKDNVLWSGRVIMTANTDFVSSQVLPNPTSSDYDKFSLLYIKIGEHIRSKGYGEWDEIIAEEAPMFLNYLMNFKIPEKFRDPRFGVKAYRSNDVIEIIDSESEDSLLVDLLMEVAESRGGCIVGSAAEIGEMCTRYEEGTDDFLKRFRFKSVKGAGGKLTELSKRYDFIEKVSHGGRYKYKIHQRKIKWEGGLFE